MIERNPCGGDSPGETGRSDEGAGARDRKVKALADEALRRLASRAPHGPEARARLIQSFCDMLAGGDGEIALQFVERLRADGESFAALHLDWIAPAARRLGRDWVEDSRSFASVTLAAARLHRILRRLGADERGEAGIADPIPRVIIASPDGESHTLGSEIFANLLRHDGWSVALSLGETLDGLCARLEARPCDAIVVVSYDPDADVTLTDLIQGLRATCGGRMRVALAGGVLVDASLSALDAADLLLPDLETAIARLDALVSKILPEE